MPKNELKPGQKADETHSGIEVDQTPPSPQVEGGNEVETAAETGRHTTAISRVVKLAAVGAISSAVLVTNLKRNGPPTPRPPQVIKGSVHGAPGRDGGSDPDISGAEGAAGAPPDASLDDASDLEAGVTTFTEDICDQLTFASDAKPEEMGAPDAAGPCRFETQPDGKIKVTGQTLIDAEGKPRDCFITPEWSMDAAVKVRGEIEGSYGNNGKIFLENGKLCVTMLHNQPQEKADVVVMGEATLTVMTTDRVMIKTLNPEIDEKTGKTVFYVMVAPVKGETVIAQEGRAKAIHLNEGDTAVKIPLNVETVNNMGCYIASPNDDAQEEGPVGLTVLTAGALFLALRRRKRLVN